MSGKSARPLFYIATLALIGTAAFLLLQPSGKNPADEKPLLAGLSAPAAGAGDEGMDPGKSAARVETDVAHLSTDAPVKEAELTAVPRLADCEEGCAHCASLKKLAEAQEKYAGQRLAEILSSRKLDSAQTGKLRRACNQLAEAVMLEWSPDEDAPVLQSEATIRALEAEIILPMLADLSAE